MRTVKRLRLEKGWSQKDLADKSGVGQDTISGIESGKHEPRPSTLRKLAEALDAEVVDFFSEPQELTPPKAPWRSLEEFLQEDVGHAYLATLSREELRKGAREEGREFGDACGEEYDAVIALRKETGHSMEGPISLFSSGETLLDVYRKYTAVQFAHWGEEAAAAEEARVAATVA